MPDKTDLKALWFDAYFTDEFGVINTPANVNEDKRIGLHKSVFTDFVVSQGILDETSRSGIKVMKNMADPVNNSIIRARMTYITNPVCKVADLSHTFQFYFSDAIIAYWESS